MRCISFTFLKIKLFKKNYYLDQRNHDYDEKYNNSIHSPYYKNFQLHELYEYQVRNNFVSVCCMCVQSCVDGIYIVQFELRTYYHTIHQHHIDKVNNHQDHPKDHMFQPYTDYNLYPSQIVYIYILLYAYYIPNYQLFPIDYKYNFDILRDCAHPNSKNHLCMYHNDDPLH